MKTKFILFIANFVIFSTMAQVVSKQLSIEEQHIIEVGGVQQALLFRGTSAENPLLIIMHGGWGPSMIYAHYRNNSELEKHFTVVEWDQRGTGKSFSKKLDQTSFNIEQFVSDAHQVIEYSCEKLGKEKVYILAESWGSVIGLNYVVRHPERVAAYISSPQVVNTAENNDLMLKKLRKLALEKGNKKYTKKLAKIEVPTVGSTGKEIKAYNKTTAKALAKLDDDYGFRELKKVFMRAVKTSPYYSFKDRMNTYQGMSFFSNSIMQTVLSVNMPEQIPEVKVPVVFLYGRKDMGTGLIKDYYSKLKAPQKELIEFENSGHIPRAEEEAKFEEVMISILTNLVQFSEN